jgi:isovaleryl-CoA dehydrogenase
MNHHAQDRKAFGKPINEFGQVQKMIADSYAEYMAGIICKHKITHKAYNRTQEGPTYTMWLVL